MNKKFSHAIVFLMILAVNCSGQLKRDLQLSLGLGFPKGIIVSAKYFPVDDFAVEIHGGAIPNLMNFGFGFHYYLSSYDSPNTFVSAQMTLMEAWKGDVANRNDVEAKGFSISLIDVGLGWQNDSATRRFYVLFGPAVAFIQERSRHPVYGTLYKDDGIFTPFLDAGIYLPKLN